MNNNNINMTQEQQHKEDSFEQIESTLGRGEQFIEKNQNKITMAVLAILVVVGAYFAYGKLVTEPKNKEVESQIFVAQNYFARDSFELALNGDGNALGFLDIIKDYSSTPSGNIAYFYAGLSYLHLGEYEKSIDYLKNFSSDDFLISNMATANIGDAYMQLKNYKEAAAYYAKAASSKANDFSTPSFLLKNGMAEELNGNNDVALKSYNKIQKEFPNSAESRDIEKYIARVELKLAK